jgi:hypothetical protein
VVLLTINLTVSSEAKPTDHAGLIHRIKRSSRNCIQSISASTPRNDTFPPIPGGNITCKPGCHTIEYEITYAVIKVERVVIGCRKDKKLPTQRQFLNGKRKVTPVCRTGYTDIKRNISEAYKTNGRLEVREKEILIDCVNKQI